MANKWHDDEIKKRMRALMRQRLKLAAEFVEGAAKLRCPVDTGNLRASITHRLVRFDTARIGTNVEYGPYVELGTIHQTPKPFLRRGLLENKSAIQKILQQ